MPRKLVSVDEETYRQLVRTKGRFEMELGRNITLGAAIKMMAGSVGEKDTKSERDSRKR